MKIKNVHAIEILDSRGIPTISTEIELWSGDKARGEVPSGASTGVNEVLELRDGDKARYNGKGVLKAVEIVNTTIKNAVIDKEFESQKQFDDFLRELDGTENKSKLGGNSILSCSMAFCKAVAKRVGIELYEYIGMIYWEKEYSVEKFKLPRPQILVMEGGKHGNWSTDIQEYMVVPKEGVFPNFKEQLRAGSEIFHALHDVLDEKGYSVGVGFEGAYIPKELSGNKESLDIILEGIKRAGYKPGEQFEIALDFAASEFFNKESGKYDLKKENKSLSPQEWYEIQKEWYSQYPIYSTEDMFEQDSWESWTTLTQELGSKLQVVGDDLLVTNTKLIQKGIQEKAINAVLIKLNQIGTVTETLEAIKMTVDNGMNAVISHRGGETNDDFIADLVVGTPAQQSKFGGPDRGERLAKYNRLLIIENSLGK
ncbi:phosphopyruvate hydratase [Candidatus Dojkabacteria bacterium HGW-Dojkabacteria-1]|uniref:Enolase n=1 Tax=Candidatus Dojkabacteria bacterium HGW-Dojkabacteria-1 TaxID=2013761 RepID=A0A2N2F398_9BACT|nr:MAG: phosphopyruvate hydratase [Candidatus Dojkabacteria bacterium HGW-Dojkabacteria-1]